MVQGKMAEQMIKWEETKGQKERYDKGTDRNKWKNCDDKGTQVKAIDGQKTKG